MKVGIDQTHINAPQPSIKSRTSQLRRVRTSKMLASDADDFRMTGSSSATTPTPHNPTAHFAQYILGIHKKHDKPQHQHGSQLHSASRSSRDPSETPSPSGGSSHHPLLLKGINDAPESNTTSLVAMIQGIFGGRESSTSQAIARSNLNLPDENAFAFVPSQHHGKASSSHQATMTMLPARESRQEDSSGAGSSSGMSNDDKPRSKGIPIQRSLPSQSSLDDDSSSSESADDACKETYDWATWRMYNRIVDHRAKYPVNASYRSNQHYGASGRSPRYSSQFVESSGVPFEDLRSQLLRGEKPVMDGEVFHLEM